MTRLPIAMLLTALLAPLVPHAGAGDVVADATVVVVVRHAEKATDDPRDPTLSDAGRARAQALADALVGAGLDAVYTTQYRRTRLTAAPAAEAAGLEVQVRPVGPGNAASYDADLIREIRALPPGSTVLVVGHSNTVPGLVEALGAQDAADMTESEFDRFTVVLLPAQGRTRVITTRY
jgi:broad specificity phosphatase PhoE